MIAGIALIGSACCTPDYAYVPTTNATAELRGHLASDYLIPPEQPHGDVQVATFGFADLTPGDDAGSTPEIRTIHLRLVVANESEQPWTLDTRTQRLALPARGQSAPAFASADHGAVPPILSIEPHGKRVVDLFFPLPPDEQHAGDLPDFDMIWSVQTDRRLVTERTPFERVALEPPPAYYDYGGPYWYDPLYVGAGFYGVLPPPYVRERVYVHRFRGGSHEGYHGSPHRRESR